KLRIKQQIEGGFQVPIVNNRSSFGISQHPSPIISFQSSQTLGSGDLPPRMGGRIELVIVFIIPVFPILALGGNDQRGVENVDERRLLRIKQFRPERVEEIDQKGGDVLPILVGIGRNVDLAVAQGVAIDALTG